MLSMRYSRLISTTRETPGAAQTPGHALLMQAGFIRELSEGLYSFLPLGSRVLANITRLIRAEMHRLEGQEVLVPLVNPADIWERSGRAALLGEELVQFSDRTGRRLVLAPTHEEAMVDLLRNAATSQRQFPIFLFQFQTKFRNEARPRGGLLRTREFEMSDGYSFHRTFAGLNNFVPRVHEAYLRIFRACNLPVVTAAAAADPLPGDRSLEFYMPWESGDDVLVRCSECGQAVNQEIAGGGHPQPERVAETRCIHCGAELRRERAVELGTIQRLGDSCTRRLKLLLTDGSGRRFFPHVGAYGIGIGRLMAAVAEANNDRRGLVWPVALAPFPCYLAGIGRAAVVSAAAEALHEELGDDVLYDDRRESINAKFRDADLMGVPFRLIVSRRTLDAGRVELLTRGSCRVEELPLAGAAQTVLDRIREVRT